MNHAGGYTYRATIPATEIKEGCFSYNIVVCQGYKRQTFPSGVARSPLDWDYTSATMYFLNAVTESDLMALAQKDTDSQTVTPTAP